MEANKGVGLNKKMKFGNLQEFNSEEYEKYIKSIKKENEKELVPFFLNELVGEYGYKAVLNSLDNITSNNALDITIKTLTEKLGREAFQDYIFYYRNINTNDYKNSNPNNNIN